MKTKTVIVIEYFDELVALMAKKPSTIGVKEPSEDIRLHISNNCLQIKALDGSPIPNIELHASLASMSMDDVVIHLFSLAGVKNVTVED